MPGKELLLVSAKDIPDFLNKIQWRNLCEFWGHGLGQGDVDDHSFLWLCATESPAGCPCPCLLQ